MATFEDLYCTDEQVAERCVGDYPALVPRSQSLAAGTDGVLAAGGFTLVSASNDFAARGIGPGHVCRLLEKKTSNAIVFYADLVAVVSAVGTTLSLRRFGHDAGEGMPVGYTAEMTSISFEVPTVRPAIVTATRWLNQRYRLTSASQLDTPEDLQTACVLKVLTILYGQQHQGGEKYDQDIFRAKYLQYLDELAAELKGLDGTYGAAAIRRLPRSGQLEPDSTWRVPTDY